MQKNNEHSVQPLRFTPHWRRAILCILLLGMVMIILTSSRPGKSSAGDKTMRQSGTPSRWLSKLIGSAALPRKDPLAGLTPKAYAQLKLREAEDNSEPL